MMHGRWSPEKHKVKKKKKKVELSLQIDSAFNVCGLLNNEVSYVII